MQASKDPIVRYARSTLRQALYWLAGSVAFAVYAGITVDPPLSYTIGAALLGVVWAGIIALHWRTRSSAWSILGGIVLVVGLLLLRDAVFPGTGFVRSIYGFAVAIATGVLLLFSFRGRLSQFCKLNRDEPIA